MGEAPEAGVVSPLESPWGALPAQALEGATALS